jgi:pimeloyl-ACP methyl ester carboxylesterase
MRCIGLEHHCIRLECQFCDFCSMYDESEKSTEVFYLTKIETKICKTESYMFLSGNIMRCMVRNCDVYYEVFGEGLPVINLHGSTLDVHSMIGCMEPIFTDREGWKRIYLDLPGHGKTRGQDWIKGSDDILQVVLDFIDSIIPDTPFVLAGLSYGGYIARGIVHHRPKQVVGLLLFAPRVVSDPRKRTLPAKCVLAREDKFLEEIDPQVREGFEEVAVVQTQSHWNRYVKEIIPGVNVADTQFLERLQPAVDAFSFNVDELSEKYEKPTLILTGRQDHWVGYQDAWTILENYPRATFAVLDRAGHALQMEQSNLFDALVHEWLDRVEETLI